VSPGTVLHDLSITMVCFEDAIKRPLRRDTVDIYNPKARDRGPCKGYSHLFHYLKRRTMRVRTVGADQHCNEGRRRVVGHLNLCV